MGKRKERRLAAALATSGRRVKLDLFSEDLGGSSLQDEEVRADKDPMPPPGVPNSPSSSGQQPQNPLLLLGQYSDDELDEQSSKRPKCGVPKTSQDYLHDQESTLSDEKEVDVEKKDDPASQKKESKISESLEVLHPPKGGDAVEHGGNADSEVESAEQISAAGTSSAQPKGDVSSVWMMVLHEESNQYYYWNTETGETSWQLPEVLAETNYLTPDWETHGARNTETATLSSNDLTANVALNHSSVETTKDGSVNHQTAELQCNEPQVIESFEESEIVLLKDKSVEIEICQNELRGGSDADAPLTAAPLTDGGLLISNAVTNDAHKQKGGADLSIVLIDQCKSLLERLKSLQGYDNRLSKYVLELAIRLYDIQSLSEHGPSLLPFWVHSERKLKQLEDVINNEIYQLAVSAQIGDDVEANAGYYSKETENRNTQVNNWNEFEEDRPGTSSKLEPAAVPSSIQENSPVKSSYANDLNDRQVSSDGSPYRPSEDNAMISGKMNGTANLMTEFHVGDGIDMDVDMEVDDETAACAATLTDDSTFKSFSPTEQLIHPDLSVEHTTSGAGVVPTGPPPEEEWIPPPPPDTDQVPPPPPEYETVPPPPESSYASLSSYGEIIQPLPYPDQYNLTYTDSSYHQYYAHTLTVPSDNIYGHDGSQAIYYGAVPNTYVDTASVMVSHIEPVMTYYNLHDGSIPSVPGVNTSGPSQSTIESGPVSYGTVTLSQVSTADDETGLGSKVKHDKLDAGVETDLTANHNPATISAKENVVASSTTAASSLPGTAESVPSMAAKVQTKVSRGKKRTVAAAPSLRSNKKVSSLVDKWKAAKEELEENEEDEAESAYENLERKRQREIEDWHAKQIASGEAKDNANFQPLGGDWREKVKRRRAQAAKEAAQEAPKKDENQQPDLAQLTRALPSGWQAYWDQSSGQVYYGNSITSETTWTRPTK